MNSPTAYPLQWPQGWPRTDRHENARFKTTLSAALSELERQLRLMSGSQLVLSSNYTLGSNNPKDPGVVAYFKWRDQTAPYSAPLIDMAIPCDRWAHIEDNVLAIAKTIDAMRGIERWGAKHMIKAIFTGFKALPASASRDWWAVLGVARAESIENCNTAYRRLATERHPDRGGSHEAFVELNAAWDSCKKEKAV